MKIGNIKLDNYEIRIEPNDTDDFSQLSIINGLYVRNGGTHIEYILEKIVNPIRDKLQRKYKTIKPADIKNKLKIMVVIRKFEALEFTSQEKIEISNHQSTFREFFSDVNWDKVSKQLMKNDDLMLNITEYFALKEKAKENAELKKLQKTSNITYEKYTEPIHQTKRLFICEGESAFGGLSPALGRKDIGYFELKGVPLNAWEISPSKLKTNEEFSNLYMILKQENYEEIVIAADADADGNHIVGLVVGFLIKFLPEYKDRIYRFESPIMAVKKGKKLVKWTYDIEERFELKSGEAIKYYKGFGSWKKEDLKFVITKDGLDTMCVKLDIKSEQIVDDWLNKNSADKRKEYILENVFDINKL